MISTFTPVCLVKFGDRHKVLQPKENPKILTLNVLLFVDAVFLEKDLKPEGFRMAEEICFSLLYDLLLILLRVSHFSVIQCQVFKSIILYSS